MRIGRLDRNKLAALFVWIYVIEATTFYIKSNFIDNAFQLGAILVMCFLLVASGRASRLRISNEFLLYLLLLLLGLIPDLLSGYFSTGLVVMVSYALPLFMYFYVFNRFHEMDRINKWMFTVPVVYGTIVSTSGIIQEAASLMGLPISIWLENIDKTGNSNVSMCSLFGIPLGEYSSWGNIAGRTLLRIQGFYIEPSKMAMFLMIPIFFAWGLYKETKQRKYKYALILCSVCFALTMSRAGIVSIVAALVVKHFYNKRYNKKNDVDMPKTTKNDLLKLFGIAFGIPLAAVMVLLLMVQLSNIFPGLEFLHVGITDLSSGKVNLIRKETVDISTIVNGLISQPYGFGFANNLHGSSSSVLDTNLANAFILWLVTGGFFGAVVAIVIMLLTLIHYVIPCIKSNEPLKTGVGLAFFGLMIHSLSYGTWMTPEFLLVMAIMSVLYNKSTLILE